MSARTVSASLAHIERAALSQLVRNIQRADELLAVLEGDVPRTARALVAWHVAQIRAQLYRLPPGFGEDADDALARAWGETDTEGGNHDDG